MRGMKRTVAGVAAIALAAGVLAGCGSSSSDTASSAEQPAESVATTAALSKAEYVAQANAICTKIDDTASALDDNADSETLAQAEASLKKVTAAAEEGVAQLKALVPPADLQAAHDTLVQTSADSIGLFKRLVTALDSDNVNTTELNSDLEQAMALEKKQTAAAKELGLSNCFTGQPQGADDADTNDDGAND